MSDVRIVRMGRASDARARDASGRLDVGRARERARGVSRDAREDGGDERGVRGMSESSGVRASGAVKAASEETDADAVRVAERLRGVRRKILVLSGEGWGGEEHVRGAVGVRVGESRGRDVGLLDVDICGPSVPLMCGEVGAEVHKKDPVGLRCTWRRIWG